MTGADVTSLQAYLATDTSLYPQGLVTGYFGPLTSAAVSRFQSRNGIDSVGRVGPITLAALNLKMGGTVMNTGGSAPVISGVQVNAGRNSVAVVWNTNEPAKGVVYYSTSALTTYENPQSVNIGGASVMTDTALRYSQNVSVPNLSANTVYYYMIHTTDQEGNVSVTWPSTFRTNN